MDSVTNTTDNLEIKPVLQSPSLLKEWLSQCNCRLTSLIDGKWTTFAENSKVVELREPTTDVHLGFVQEATQGDFDSAIRVSMESSKKLAALKDFEISMIIYSLGKAIENNTLLYEVAESIGSGMPIKYCKEYAVPNAMNAFYEFSKLISCAKYGFGKSNKAYGPVIVVPDEACPLSSACSKIGAALSCGNSVIVLNPIESCLSLFILCEMAQMLTPVSGVINVLPVYHETLINFTYPPAIRGIFYEGSADVGKKLIKLNAGNGAFVSVDPKEHSCAIVFDSADLDSAANLIVNGALFGNGRAPLSTTRILIQETVYNEFLKKLERVFENITEGHSLDLNCDVALKAFNWVPLSLQEVKSSLDREGIVMKRYPSKAKSNGVDSMSVLENIQPSSFLHKEEGLRPYLKIFPFKTPRQGVIAANELGRLAPLISIWTDNIGLALETAKMLSAEQVSINSIQSKEVMRLFRFGQLLASADNLKRLLSSSSSPLQCNETDLSAFGLELPGIKGSEEIQSCHKIFKPYIAGKYADVKGCRFISSFCAFDGSMSYVALATEKHMQSAIAAAKKAFKSWTDKTSNERSQYLFEFARNYSNQMKQVMSGLKNNSDATDINLNHQVTTVPVQVTEIASLCQTAKGNIVCSNQFEDIFCYKEPVGVIALVCGNNVSWSSALLLMLCAIALGNTVVVMSNEIVFILSLCEIFNEIGIPDGVINVLGGNLDIFTKKIAVHNMIDAVWYCDSIEGAYYLKHTCANTLKSTWFFDSNVSESCLQGAVANGLTSKLVHVPKGYMHGN